jgi:hypothetical protein
VIADYRNPYTGRLYPFRVSPARPRIWDERLLLGRGHTKPRQPPVPDRPLRTRALPHCGASLLSSQPDPASRRRLATCLRPAVDGRGRQLPIRPCSGRHEPVRCVPTRIARAPDQSPSPIEQDSTDRHASYLGVAVPPIQGHGSASGSSNVPRLSVVGMAFRFGQDVLERPYAYVM